MSCRNLALLLSACLICLQASSLAAQTALTPADYGKWETPGSPLLSPDGEWVAYVVSRVDGKWELRVHGPGPSDPKVIEFGNSPLFSKDSRYLACGVGMHEERREELQKAGKPIRNDMALLDLNSGEVAEFEAVSQFEFDHLGRFLARLSYPLDAGEDSQDEKKPQEKPRHNLVVRDLPSGRETAFGNVSQYAWQDEGSLLALAISAPERSGNGVQLYQPEWGRLLTLDSNRGLYSQLAWREESDDLAVLRSSQVEGYREEAWQVLAWRGLEEALEEGAAPIQPLVFDPAAFSDFPKEYRIVDFRRPSWSSQGERLFFGIQEWDKVPEKEEAPKSDEASTQGEGTEKPEGQQKEGKANVEVWHARDTRVIPQQKLTQGRDKERNWLSCWNLESGTFLRLVENDEQEAWPVPKSRYAILADSAVYRFEGLFGRPKVDLWRIDLVSGERASLVTGLPGDPLFGGSSLEASPEGRFLLYLRDDQYWLHEIEANRPRCLTCDLSGTAFVDLEDDHPSPQKPPHGVAGWLEGGRSVLIHDKYDLWEFPIEGPPRRLTLGAPDRVVHRFEQLDREADAIDASQPLHLSLFGEWSKRSGFARLQLSGSPPALERLIWLEGYASRLTKAEKAERFAYLAEAFDDPGDVFVSGRDFSEARRLSRLSPFHGEYSWGRSSLIEYQDRQGRRLQGALYYPAGFQEGRTYPLVVYIYERLSQRLHRFSPPSERSPYNPTVLTSLGYLVLMPDIAFEVRQPGPSIVDCVQSAVEKVLEMGVVDPGRLGLVGHSWGGYGTAYVASRTPVFAAAVAGAPLTNFFSMYGSVFWNTGIPETGHFEVGQERMEVPYWKDPQAYIENSPIFGVEGMTTPLLVAFGDKDGSVDWHQGIEMYNAARRAGKQMVLLVYPGENHSLRQKANQIDYHRRILEWFGHYLKGEEAPSWITEGVPHLEQVKESGN